MYPKTYRASRTEIALVKKIGSLLKGQYLGVSYIQTDKKVNPKFAIIVSTKVSPKAVERNKIKRAIRKALFNMLADFKDGLILLILTNKKSLEITPSIAECEIREIVDKIYLHK